MVHRRSQWLGWTDHLYAVFLLHGPNYDHCRIWWHGHQNHIRTDFLHAPHDGRRYIFLNDLRLHSQYLRVFGRGWCGCELKADVLRQAPKLVRPTDRSLPRSPQHNLLQLRDGRCRPNWLRRVPTPTDPFGCGPIHAQKDLQDPSFLQTTSKRQKTVGFDRSEVSPPILQLRVIPVPSWRWHKYALYSNKRHRCIYYAAAWSVNLRGDKSLQAAL